MLSSSLRSVPATHLTAFRSFLFPFQPFQPFRSVRLVVVLAQTLSDINSSCAVHIPTSSLLFQSPTDFYHFCIVLFKGHLNTAKVSPLLVSRTSSYPTDLDSGQLNPTNLLSPDAAMSQTTGRRRRSSSLIYQEPQESIEHTNDQAALPNLNATWVNAKGKQTELD